VRDDVDRAAFVERLGDILGATGTRCYAMALLANHMHLLLRTVAPLWRRSCDAVLTDTQGSSTAPSPHGISSRIATNLFLCQENRTCSSCNVNHNTCITHLLDFTRKSVADVLRDPWRPDAPVSRSRTRIRCTSGESRSARRISHGAQGRSGAWTGCRSSRGA